jgi:hypothetical protein
VQESLALIIDGEEVSPGVWEESEMFCVPGVGVKLVFGTMLAVSE